MEKKGEPADPDPGDPGKSSESSNSGGVKSVELKNALPPATTITKESSAAGSKLSKSGGSSASSLSGVDPPSHFLFQPPLQTSARGSLLRVEIGNETSQGIF